MKTYEVFGIKPNVVNSSYIDRLSLDAELKKRIDRKQQHVAIRGASKCGKSWLRQKVLQNPILVQCRLDKTATDIYVDALSQLGIKLEIDSVTTNSFKGTISAEGEASIKLLAKVTGKAEGEYQRETETTRKAVGHDINDLKFIADILRESGRTLVIEDFHYLCVPERKRFAFDLKSFWDYGVFVIVIGVWTLDNMLLSLNPDLSGRIEELSIDWPVNELQKILELGGQHLNLTFTDPVKQKLSEISFGSAGILQNLTLRTLDELDVEEGTLTHQTIGDLTAVETAAMQYAEQLNPLYQEFAKTVSLGIRSRQNSTGIYAYTISTILESSDEELTKGLEAQTIFRKAHAKQSRIQLSNLKSILQKFEELQIDDAGRGLILAYNPATEKVTAVDRQLLLYRRYKTLHWPWEDMIAQAEANPQEQWDF